MFSNRLMSISINCIASVRRFHVSSICRSIQELMHSKRIKPVELAFNIYESNKTNAKHTPPLIVMHGLFGSKNNWNSLSKAINNLTGRKVIAVDCRNHGASPHTDEFSYFHLAEDINHLLKLLSIPEATIIGHSMGGRAAMLFSHAYPENVDKLIVVDISHKSPGGELPGMSKYFEVMNSVNVNPNLTMPEGRKKADEQLAISIPDMEIRQFLLTNLIKEKGNFKWRINLGVLEKVFFSEINEFPFIDSVFNKPTLFILGRKSSYFRIEDRDEIIKMFPKVIFEYLDAGHWVHAEKPKEFLDLVNEFLK